MIEITVFGKLSKNSNGDVIVVLPHKISDYLKLNKEVVVNIKQPNEIEKLVTKYRDVTKVCIVTK